MWDMEKLQAILIRFVGTMFVMLGAQFIISLVVDAYFPGTRTRAITNTVYAGLAFLFLFTTFVAVSGFFIVAWKELNEQRIYEVPITAGHKYYLEVPANRSVNMMALGEAEIKGVALGNNSRVRPISRHAWDQTLGVPFPTPEHDPELLQYYLREIGGNGS